MDSARSLYSFQVNVDGVRGYHSRCDVVLGGKVIKTVLLPSKCTVEEVQKRLAKIHRDIAMLLDGYLECSLKDPVSGEVVSEERFDYGVFGYNSHEEMRAQYQHGKDLESTVKAVVGEDDRDMADCIIAIKADVLDIV